MPKFRDLLVVTALDRIEAMATKHRDYNQTLDYETRADMGWIVEYVQYLRRSIESNVMEVNADASKRP